LDTLFINTSNGAVPLSNFATREAAQKVSVINRAQAERVMTLTANVRDGVQTATAQAAVLKNVESLQLKGVRAVLKGEDEERDKASAFLGKAFGTAIFMIFAVLLAQFNRFSSVIIIMSAVIFSTIGVFLGLIVTGQTFSVVMTGLGIISIAGIIVNNNILLIDTFDTYCAEGMSAHDALLETCRQRARPVFLSAITCVLGVLPIAFGINIDLAARDISIGAPSTQWWVQLSTATAFGIAFATVLTLVVTPAMLIANLKMRAAVRRVWERRRKVKVA
jgi:multidrug efflux pump